MDASSSEPATPILNKKRSKSAISVVIPHEPFMDNRDPLSPEEVRRLIEEKIYWTNEARAWKERAQELMSALREIAEIKHLPSDVDAILNAAEVREMTVGPVSLTLQAPRQAKKKNAKKRKEPVEVILSDEGGHTDKKKRKAAATEAMKRLSQFLSVPQGIEVLLENIPNIEVKSSIWRSPAVKQIGGPSGSADTENQDDKDAIQSYGELAAGLSISTYPFLVEDPSGPRVQAGSPNCDHFTCSMFAGGIVACVTDGCGWGSRSQSASRMANQHFVDFVVAHLPVVTDFQQAALLLMRAIQVAHEKIVEGARRAWEVGTTTLCGGILFQIADDQVQEFGAPYAFLSVNLGDCKAYYCTQRIAGGEVKRPGQSGSSGALNVPPRSLNASSASISASTSHAHAAPARESSAILSGSEQQPPANPPISTYGGGGSASVAGGSQVSITQQASSSQTGQHVGPVPLTPSSFSRDHLFPQRLRWNVSDITTGNRISDAKTTGGHLGPKSGPNETQLSPDLGNLTIHVTPCSKGDMLVLVSDGVHDNLDPETLNLDPQQAGLDYAEWGEVPIEEKVRAKDIYRADVVAQHIDNTRSPSEIAVNMLKWVRKVTENKRMFMESNPGKEEPAELPGKMDHTTIVVFSVD